MNFCQEPGCIRPEGHAGAHTRDRRRLLEATQAGTAAAQISLVGLAMTIAAKAQPSRALGRQFKEYKVERELIERLQSTLDRINPGWRGRG